ncbi:MAG: ribonuclease HII [Erysipelotrichaceae bacterium]|nr:ribonuclease HII [Erysipelotrichaceae bacterium]
MGIDEAGRGPIAGPLVVACCVLPIGYENKYIYDSKSISLKQREAMFHQIVEDAVYYQSRIVTPKKIDEDNIYEATRKAMESLAISYDVDHILTDAMPLRIGKDVISLIKGDQKSVNIAAASILAKVLRNHIMNGYNVLYPEYDFKNHKGYPTAKHLKALDELPVLEIYRRSYKPVAERLHKQIRII